MGAKLVSFEIKPRKNEQIEAFVKIPEETRSVIHGVVKDYCNKRVKDAVVKLFVRKRGHNKCDLKPIAHTFTDECGQFIFGPLMPNRQYVIKVWVNRIKIRYIKVDPDDCDDKENELDYNYDNDSYDNKKHHDSEGCIDYDHEDCRECDGCKDCDCHEECDDCNDCDGCENYDDYKEHEYTGDCEHCNECEYTDGCEYCSEYVKDDEGKEIDVIEATEETEEAKETEESKDCRECNEHEGCFDCEDCDDVVGFILLEDSNVNILTEENEEN